MNTSPELAGKSGFWRRARCSRSVQIGAALLGFWLLCALAGPWLWPVDPFSQSLSQRLLPPAWAPRGLPTHPLGTDHLGRDVLARLLHGSRISLSIGFGSAGLGAVIGVALGVCAGYLGGWTDRVVMFLLTCKLALPSLLLSMTLIYFLKPSVTTVIAVIGVMHWSLYLVVTRTSTQRIRELDFVRAARVAGASAGQIMRWDVLPNLLGAILVVFTFEVAVSILAEASLSFLGVGVPSPTPSWGLMIAEGKASMFIRPWLVALPGAALFMLVVGVNMLGDGLRDAAQPQTRN